MKEQKKEMYQMNKELKNVATVERERERERELYFNK